MKHRKHLPGAVQKDSATLWFFLEVKALHHFLSGSLIMYQKFNRNSFWMRKQRPKQKAIYFATVIENSFPPPKVCKCGQSSTLLGNITERKTLRNVVKPLSKTTETIKFVLKIKDGLYSLISLYLQNKYGINFNGSNIG